MELLHLLTNIVRKETSLSEMDFYSRPSEHPTLRQSSYVANKQYNKQSYRSKLTITKNSQTCAFCGSNNHSALNCSVFTTPRQRSEEARKRRLCYNCLSPRHNTRDCKSRFRCKMCSRKHHTSLCTAPKPKIPSPTKSSSLQDSKQQEKQECPYQKFNPRLDVYRGRQEPPQSFQSSSRLRNHAVHFDVAHCVSDEQLSSSEAESKPLPTPSKDAPNDITFMSNETSDQPVPLMCAEVKLFNPNDPSHYTTVSAFLDCGSTVSYITNELAEHLDLPTVATEILSVSTFGGPEPLMMECAVYKVGIETENGAKCLTVKSAPFLADDITQIIPGGNLSVTSCKPSILIGNDYFWDIVLSHNFYYKNLSEGHRLLHTTIGDIILKKALDTRCNDYSFASVESGDSANPANHNDLCELVSRFWKLETIGIVDNPNQKEDAECLEYFNNTIYYDYDEKRYIVSLPFKEDPTKVPDNYSLAYSRLRSQLKQLQQNPLYLKRYHAVIQDQLQRNIIECVPLEEIHKPCHYLSHHGVIKKDDKDLKIRCVYDGSAKMKSSMSLNEALHRGPVLLPDLVGILIRSRLCKILVSSDIEKAFLMVGLNHNCRDYTRFLWVDDPTGPLCTQNLITYRFTRVPFGLVSSPFLLAGTIHFHLSSMATELSRHLIRNTYVDNVFYAAKNVEDGKSFYNKAKELFKKAGMNLRAFASNSEKLNQYISMREIEAMHNVQKVLGLKWDITTDDLIIPLPERPSNKELWTKRKVLKHIASIYDPLGLLSPATLPGKAFLQSLWKDKLLWDETLPAAKEERWEEILSSWTVPGISTPRLIVECEERICYEYDLHVFADASSVAYCVTAYLVQRKENTPIRSSLIMSKSRLAPLGHSMTIPRLEIAALMMGSKLLTYVAKELDTKISRKFLWTDSLVALYWTKNNKNLPIFVRNRVNIILENTSDAHILHVPSELNPADLGTRGCLLEE
ncbi:unnamed protein product, partial [Cylicostephanus goldi]